MPLTESLNNGYKLLRKTCLFAKSALLVSECKEVKYPIDLLNYLEDNFLTILLSSPSLLLTTSASLAMFNGKFSADLVVELILLPILAFLPLSINDGKFLADWIRLVLSIDVSGLAIYRSFE